jgi:hypothetical protein
MTADPHIERSVRIAKAIREDSSDPVTFPLWKPWAIDMADGIGALAARLEAAERDLADTRKALTAWQSCFPSHRAECRFLTYSECTCGLDDARRLTLAALAAAQQPPDENPDG